jgi:hypothetical protein
MSSNPQTAGFAAGATLLVSGFTGGDTYFNAGVITSGVISGGYTITTVTPTTISFPLTHANASASSFGTVLQMGNATTTCGGLSNIFSDAALSVPVTQPIHSDQRGNWGTFAAAGHYYIQFYGAGVAARLAETTISCVSPGATCGTPAVTTVDGVVYPCNSTGINNAIAAVIANGGGTVDARLCTGSISMAAEIDVGSLNEVPVTLVAPSKGTWTWSLTDGISCGIQVFNKSSVVSDEPAFNGWDIEASASANMRALLCTPPAIITTTAAAVAGNVATLTLNSDPTIAGYLTGTKMLVSGFTGGDTYFNGIYTITGTSPTTITYALVHANASAGTNGQINDYTYVRIDGMGVANVAGGTMTVAAADITGLDDSSFVGNMFIRNYYGVGLYVHGTCCTANFYNISSNGGTGNNAVPVVVGVVGQNTNSVQFYSLAATHPMGGKNNVVLQGSSTWTMDVSIRGLYMEGPLCNASAIAPGNCADTTTPAVAVNMGSGTSAGGGALLEDVFLNDDVGGSTRYAIDINASSGPVEVRNARARTGNILNDHIRTFTITGAGFVPLGSYSTVSAQYFFTPQWNLTSTDFKLFNAAGGTTYDAKLDGTSTSQSNLANSTSSFVVNSGLSTSQIAQIQFQDRGTPEWSVGHNTIDSFFVTDNVDSKQRIFFNKVSAIATTGALNFANNEVGPCWLNAGASGDICVRIDGSNNVRVDGGTTTGFGTGGAGTAVTTTTKGGGTGPTTAQTIVQYLEVNINGTNYWIPLTQ